MKLPDEKRDLLLAIALAVLAICCYLIFLSVEGRREGAYVLILVDGEEVGRLSLTEDRRISLHPHGSSEGQEENILVVEEGELFVEQANCPDAYCVRQGRISREGESITCLPHRLVLEVKGESSLSSDKPDVLVR